MTSLSLRVIFVHNERAVIYPVRFQGRMSKFEPSDARHQIRKSFQTIYGDVILFENPGPA